MSCTGTHLMGLGIYSSMPAAIHCSRVPSIAFAVSPIMSVCLPCGFSNERIRYVASIPPITGIYISNGLLDNSKLNLFNLLIGPTERDNEISLIDLAQQHLNFAIRKVYQRGRCRRIRT